MSTHDYGFPTRNVAARYAEAIFHRNYNDVDVYIEDTADGYRKIFSTMLGRALSDQRVSIDRVFPLGGRSEVIAAANKEASAGSADSIFIVDGDLYLLTGEEPPPDNVCVLPVYCIENFLIDEPAILQIMFEESPELSLEEIQDLYGYVNWRNESTSGLALLFHWFAVSHLLQSGLPTVSRAYKSVCKNQAGDVDYDKVNSIAYEIEGALRQRFGDTIVDEAWAKISSSVETRICFISKYVSAKDFTLPLLICRMRNVTGSKSSNLNIKVRLSGLCSVDGLRAISDRVRSIQAER
ncbi:DUF4435 domain-containing protein [Xanthomonas sp. 60]